MILFMDQKTLLLVLNLLKIAAVLIFIRGFFPTKTPLAGLADFVKTEQSPMIQEKWSENSSTNLCLKSYLGLDAAPLGNISRLVMVVIDALRADFVLTKEGNSMNFVQNMIKYGNAIGFQARTQAPTVTMPRIKAISAGTVPAFIDALLNAVSSEFLEDNIVKQLGRAGKRIAFYGDDTWLKLFPNQFSKAEGTTSFFVADYTEVDDNVTLNMKKALDDMNSWDILILHYLGLDHIGHSFGPKCLLLPQKLAEMDDIIEHLYHNIAKLESNFMMVVIGDHGMSESGSHGGATNAETVVPLVFLSPTFNNSTLVYAKHTTYQVQQVDIVPTLATVLGLPIPQNSVGWILYDVIYGISHDSFRTLGSAVLNYWEILQIYSSNVNVKMDSTKQNAIHEAIDLLNNKCSRQDSHLLEKNANILTTHLQELGLYLRQQLIASFEEYNGILMFIGCSLASGALVISASCLYSMFKTQLLYHQQIAYPFFLTGIVIAGSVSQALTFFSSSFVEEEHQCWYFLWPSLLICLFYVNMVVCFRKEDIDPWILWKFLVLLCLHGILRRWNQTGIKWSHLPDISDWLNNYPYQLKLVFAVVTLLCLAAKSVTELYYGHHKVLALIGYGILCWYYHVTGGLIPQSAPERGLFQAWILYGIIISLTVIAPDIHWTNINAAVTLLFLLLLKTNDLFLFLGTVVTIHGLKSLMVGMKSVFFNIVGVYWLSVLCYFYLGNSNGLGTIDLSSGYVGLTDFYPAVVCLLMLTHLYCGPVTMWLEYLSPEKTRDANFGIECAFIVTFLRSLSLTIVLISVTLQRYHLFVWSVFAPKLVYEAFHTVIFSGFVVLCCLFVFRNVAPN